MALRPISFDWKVKEFRGDKKQYSFIAQEYEKVFPDQIHYVPVINEKEKELVGKDGVAMSMTTNLMPFVVKSIQELQQQIDELKKSDKTK